MSQQPQAELWRAWQEMFAWHCYCRQVLRCPCCGILLVTPWQEFAVGHCAASAQGYANLWLGLQEPDVAETVETVVLRAGDVPRPNVYGV